MLWLTYLKPLFREITMIDYYYAGFDGHKHHGCIADRMLAESSQDGLWAEVVDYVRENSTGKAMVRIIGTNKTIEVIS